jgi:hypothetical protein
VKILAIFSSILFFCFNLKAQENDFALWSEVSLEKMFTPRFSIKLREALRTAENSTRIDNHFTQLNFSYILTNKIDISVAYRNAQKFKFDETVSYRSRFHFDLRYKIKFKKFDFVFQERIQSRFSDINRSDDWQTPKNVLRSRLTIRYDFEKRFKPFFYYEFSYNLNDKLISNQRFRLGLDYEINKKQACRIFYMIDQELNRNNPLSTFALGLQYRFRI